MGFTGKICDVMKQNYRPYNILVFLATGDWQINTFKRLLTAVGKELNNRTPSSILLCMQRPVCFLTAPILSPKRWYNKITGKSCMKKATDNIYIITPWVVLHDIAARYVPFAEKVNCWLVGKQIKRATNLLGIKVNIVWLSHPYQAAYVNTMPGTPVIYQCFDAFEEFAPNKILKERIVKDEIKILKQVRCVFATSTALVEKCSKINPNVWGIPNGADYEHFANKYDDPSILNKLPRPLIGFVGKINGKINFKLINDIARLKPNWSFIYLGVFDGTKKLEKDADYILSRKIKNIHYMGFIEYSVLPSFVKSFNACIIPSVNSKVTNAVYPLKINEYLAAGKPVVSTSQPELECFEKKNLVVFADEPVYFVTKLAEAIETDSSEKVKERQLVASMNDWQKRAENLLNALKDL